MKAPVDPQLMRAIQLKREAGVKLAIWTVAAIAITAAWIGGLALSYSAGGGEGLFMYAAISLGAGIYFIPLSIWTFEPENPVAEYLEASVYLKELSNEIAWNAQQEELARLRTIMKEEGL